MRPFVSFPARLLHPHDSLSSAASYYDPATNQRVSLPANENGQTTLHGGKWGYSRAGWKIVEKKAEKVIFGLRDEGAEGGSLVAIFHKLLADDLALAGFPGTVYTLASYELLSHPTRLVTSFTSRVLPSTPPPAANAPSLPPGDDPLPEEPKTPIMLSSHVYWNLDGYQKDEDGAGGSARDHEVWIDARKSVEVDGELVRLSSRELSFLRILQSRTRPDITPSFFPSDPNWQTSLYPARLGTRFLRFAGGWAVRHTRIEARPGRDQGLVRKRCATPFAWSH